MTRATSLDTFIFDLDGTLIELNLDFDAIRRALGIRDRYILEAILKLDGNLRRQKLEILKEFEIRSALTAKLMPHARDVLRLLEDLGLKKGIVTRNCRESVEIVIDRFGLEFDFVITREDAKPKPSPEPIILALKIAGSKPESSIVIGDYKFDLIAGKRAGTKTALILNERNREFVHLADYVLHSLKDIEKLLR